MASTPAAAKRREPRPGKGEITRAQIVGAAVEQASAAGFESLTIGTLAGRTGLSKSGLFAHFGSRLELQKAALD
ncbi:MAG TPA: TetR/AcrR family transcriptional regulator, partial [Usitatibacter sp.]|nr:TetR/AcrR family transcriptional regulator [Usitatibacter sp.]